ncbi:uncharacterized protein LOC123532250 isoform X2 [Mercenaria mercenaria]|uniref:uncharacterized protein LOC123532250 isoform X2 n=1 Tax=Mercenaria mercenaria TaxID=6596 RepID=UPI00234F8862|nr:uncharacterized protein LOC123532250 isoform X2 [Mercenaria mercenaria]
MLRVFMFLYCILFVNGLTCPPSCEPPVKGSGCKAYTKNAVCSQDVKDISTSEAHCGCLWQTYIQTVEPEAKVIFTDEGNQCYTWAAKLCSILEKSEKSLLLRKKKPELTVFREAADLKDILRRIQHLESVNIVGGHRTEKAKHRRRNGVGTLSKETERLLNKEKQDLINSHKDTFKQKEKDKESKVMAVKGKHINFNKMHRDFKNEHKNRNEIEREFIGKPGQSRSASWVEIVPERATVIPAVTPVITAASVENIYKVRRHWIDLDMPVDQFKLGVFMIILLLNLLVVVVLIFCRDSGSDKKHTETKPQGDLHESVYYPDSPEGKPGQATQKKTQSPISKFIDSFKKKHGRNRSNASNKYLQMMEVNPDDFTSNRNAYSKVQKNSPFIDARMSESPRKISRGLYENIDEEPDSFLDHTYEEPLPVLSSRSDSREFHKRKSSLRSDSVSEEGSSPTKYFPRDLGASGKTVAFALPPGTYLTLQDRVGTEIDGSTNIEQETS